jgi:oryzin
MMVNSKQVLAVEPVMIWELYGWTTQDNTPWGLGSISHRDPSWAKYIYDSSAGEGMWAYVVDTGLYTQHESLEGRGYLGYNAYPNVTFEDHHGHGTHCAGTIASKDYGVSKKASIMSVKVFDTGSVSFPAFLALLQLLT